MAVIRLTITVDDIATVISLFDKIKVYRATAGESGPYVELTGISTRIALVTGQSVYTYDDTDGDASYWYKTSYFNATSALESSMSAAIQGDVDPLYVSIQSIRDEGVTVSQGSDARILMLIRTWQAFIERATRQWFIPKQIELEVDGTGTKLLQLSIPIVSVTNLYINDDFTTPVGASDYVAYSGRGESERDDRKNPRIKLVSADNSIFTGVGPVRKETAIFEIGEKNQIVEGSFGYVEPDGSVPLPIQYALKKLVIAHLKGLASSGGSTPAGPVIEEETDRHRRKWGDSSTASKVWPTSGDTEVDMILAQYRAPLTIRAPRTLFRRLSGGQVI